MNYLYCDLFVFVCTSLDLPNRYILGIPQVYHLSLLLILIILHNCSGLDIPIKWIPLGLFLNPQDTILRDNLVAHLIVVVLYLFHLLAHSLI